MKGNIPVNFICYLKIKEGRGGGKKGEKRREGGRAKHPIDPQIVILDLESSYPVLLNSMNMACPSPSAGK